MTEWPSVNLLSFIAHDSSVRAASEAANYDHFIWALVFIYRHIHNICFGGTPRHAHTRLASAAAASTSPGRVKVRLDACPLCRTPARSFIRAARAARAAALTIHIAEAYTRSTAPSSMPYHTCVELSCGLCAGCGTRGEREER